MTMSKTIIPQISKDVKVAKEDYNPRLQCRELNHKEWNVMMLLDDAVLHWNVTPLIFWSGFQV